MDKQSLRNDYDKKKFKQDQKGTKNTKDEDYHTYIEPIEGMGAKELLGFLEKKFDSLVEKNERLYPKIVSVVSNKIIQFRQEIQRTQFEKINSFLNKQVGRPLKGTEMTYFEQSKLHNFFLDPPAKVAINRKSEIAGSIEYSIVVQNQKQEMAKQSTQVFFFSKKSLDEFFYEFNSKRIKKQAPIMLQKYLDCMQIIKNGR